MSVRFNTGVCCLLLRTDTTTKLETVGEQRGQRTRNIMTRARYNARITDTVPVLREEVITGNDLNTKEDDGTLADKW